MTPVTPLDCAADAYDDDGRWCVEDEDLGPRRANAFLFVLIVSVCVAIFGKQVDAVSLIQGVMNVVV